MSHGRDPPSSSPPCPAMCPPIWPCCAVPSVTPRTKLWISSSSSRPPSRFLPMRTGREAWASIPDSTRPAGTPIPHGWHLLLPRLAPCPQQGGVSGTGLCPQGQRARVGPGGERLEWVGGRAAPLVPPQSSPIPHGATPGDARGLCMATTALGPAQPSASSPTAPMAPVARAAPTAPSARGGVSWHFAEECPLPGWWPQCHPTPQGPVWGLSDSHSHWGGPGPGGGMDRGGRLLRGQELWGHGGGGNMSGWHGDPWSELGRGQGVGQGTPTQTSPPCCSGGHAWGWAFVRTLAAKGRMGDEGSWAGGGQGT